MVKAMDYEGERLTHGATAPPQQAAQRNPLEVCREPLCGGGHRRVPVLRGNYSKSGTGAQGCPGGVALEAPHDTCAPSLGPP